MASVLEHRVLSLLFSLYCSLYTSASRGGRSAIVWVLALSFSVVVVESESIYLLLSLFPAVLLLSCVVAVV